MTGGAYSRTAALRFPSSIEHATVLIMSAAAKTLDPLGAPDMEAVLEALATAPRYVETEEDRLAVEESRSAGGFVSVEEHHRLLREAFDAGE